MANYLYIVTSKVNESKIDSFLCLKDNNTQDDIIKCEYNGAIKYYISHKAIDDLYNGNVFKGYSIDYNRKFVNFTSENASQDLKEGSLEGCYLFIEQSEIKITISNDCFSQLPLLFFASLECFACSDSLYVLYMLRKALNLSVDKDFKAIKSRSWVNSITNQLLSNKTPISSIKYLPPNNFLEVKILEEKPYTKIKKSISFSTKNSSSYVSVVREAAINIRSLLASYLEIYPISLSLSGGLDSRVILASVIESKYFNNLQIGTNESLESDFNIVKELSNQFGFKFNSRENYLLAKNKKIDRLSTYILVSCGIYDSIYCPASIPIKNLPIPVTGHGAELFKGNYGLRSIEKVAQDCTVNQDFFREELIEGNDKLNLEIMPELSSELHYLGYRNSLHGARVTIFSLYALRPLMNKLLVNYFNDSENIKIEERKNIINDLLILLSPDLAKNNFDSVKKNLGQEYINSRLSLLGGEVKENECFKYKFIGEPKYEGHSISSFFLNLVKNQGYTGDMDFVSLKPMIDKVTLEVDPNYRSDIEYWAELIKPLEGSYASKTEKHNIAIGKLLSMHVYK